MQSLKVGFTTLLTSAVAFTLVVGGLNLAIGLAPLSLNLVLSGMQLGAIIGAGAMALSWLFGRDGRSPLCFALASSFSGLALYYLMSLYEFNSGDLRGACVVGVFTLVTGALSACATRCIHGGR